MDPRISASQQEPSERSVTEPDSGPTVSGTGSYPGAHRGPPPMCPRPGLCLWSVDWGWHLSAEKWGWALFPSPLHPRQPPTPVPQPPALLLPPPPPDLSIVPLLV
ncbi:unnamed protein product [Lepidochelys kempii]